MAFHSAKCGCGNCLGAEASQGVRPAASQLVSADAEKNISNLTARGSAEETTIDSTPTNGANPYIDSLVWGGKWVDSAGLSTTGESTTISFYPAEGNPFGAAYGSSYAWDVTSLVALYRALQAWENVANIDFFAVTSSASADSLFWLGTSTHAYGALGWSDVPGSSSGEPLYTMFNRDDSTWTASGLAVGGYAYVTLVHEIGHLLGLAHPHDGGDDGGLFPGVSAAFGDYGDYNLNQGIYTTMSYNDGWGDKYPNFYALGYGWQATPMALDIAAIQTIYGKNTTAASGDTTYQLPTTNAAGTYWSCIWDTGGVDSITNAGSSLDSVIYLWEAGTLGLQDGGGTPSYAAGIMGGYTIAADVDIENATGGSGKDLIYGNSLANSIVGGNGNDSMTGGAGNDVIDGGAGEDTVSFSGKFSKYQISKTGDTYSVSATAGTDGVDSIINCEYLKFSDVTKSVASIRTDSASPVFESAATNVGGTKLILTYNEALGAIVPAEKAFVVSVAGKAVVVSSVAASGSTIELSLADTIKSSQAVTVAYKAAKADLGTTNRAIQDAVGNDAISLNAMPATNNSTLAAPDQTAPVFQSAATNGGGTKVILTYNEALGTNVPTAKAFTLTVAGKAVAISSVVTSGSTIELSLANNIKAGQAISLSYKAAKPDAATSNLAIQDAAGNDALKLAKITVTNESISTRAADQGQSSKLSEINVSNNLHRTHLHQSMWERSPDSAGMGWWPVEMQADMSKTLQQVLHEFGAFAENQAAHTPLVAIGVASP